VFALPLIGAILAWAALAEMACGQSGEDRAGLIAPRPGVPCGTSPQVPLPDFPPEVGKIAANPLMITTGKYWPRESVEPSCLLDRQVRDAHE
jgi:hypothetical protein